ncbi:MAG: biotin carboxylase N-terminal domain-containing protein [Alphaproteobacteria bacterium]
MFTKILVANRGEIACRVLRTAKAMGIETVLAASDADLDSPAAREADEVARIGPARATDSYLDIGKVIGAAKRSGAEAIHPGYGFLSENPDFARAVSAAGLTFIGPPADAIARMGDKLEAKRLASAAGVKVVPGHGEPVADEREAARVAASIGYPIMIKAAAGGGGKGMRIARDEPELRAGFESCRNEAAGAFSDDRVFLERFIEEPRHIEIQIIGDRHGNIVHLGERECSVQRRHQKVIEEAPSPFLDRKTRGTMAAQAVALAQAAGYQSAGTVEFMVDRDRGFYFLELNTRLQVEHPVTEMITGLDLVELMIRVAVGEPLPFTQDEVVFDGWSMEARVYAEDPARNFLPSTGRLVRYRPPDATDGLRIETGVAEGGEVSVHYDPMVAKLVTHGPDRATALARMEEALAAFRIRGVRNNLAFLAAVLDHPRFREARLSTDFVAQEFPGGYEPPAPGPKLSRRLAAVAAHVHAAHEARLSGVTPADAGGEWVVLLGEDARHEARIGIGRRGSRTILDGRAIAMEADWRLGDPFFQGKVDGQAFPVHVERAGTGYRLTHRGHDVVAKVVPPRVAELMARMPAKPAPDTDRFLLSPMPGLLVSVAVADGQPVKAGEELAVVEAMKMENALRAERDGVVKRIHAQPGDNLAVDQSILEFE